MSGSGGTIGGCEAGLGLGQGEGQEELAVLAGSSEVC